MDLKTLFQPRAVALIGASTETTKLSGRPFRFLHEYGYAGAIYPVNPKYPEIAGVRCYERLADIPGEVDLAVITLPAAAVPGALRACAAKGIRAAAVISSGFAEVGGDGVRLQEELREIALQHDIAVCGPNCSGFLYVPDMVTATFSVGLDRGIPQVGPAVFISQSGALSSYILGAAVERGLAFRYWVTTGNECVLSFTDYLRYVLEDPEVRLVLGYLEDARDGQAFQDCARRALALDKPIIVLKAGRSEAGAKASLSHTGSLAGADDVYEAVFAKHGVLRADTLDELFDLAVLAQAPRRPRGHRVQVLSLSGAAGILMADEGSEVGLAFPDLSAATVERLRQVLPAFASVANPMDVTAEAVSRPGLFKAASEVILDDPEIDTLVIFLGIVPGAHAKLAHDIAQVARGTDKLVVVIWFPLPAADVCQVLADARVPLFAEPARGMRALGKMVRYVSTRARVLAAPPAIDGGRLSTDGIAVSPRPSFERLVAEARAQGRRTLSEVETKSLLALSGLPVPRGGLARDAAEACAIARRVGGRVAMKASSPDLLHKTEAGVVRLGVATEDAERIFEEIIRAAKAWNGSVRLDGVLVEEMVTEEAREVIVGVRQDRRFGPVVTFGLGGVFVEALRDVAVIPAPFGPEDAHALIRKIRGYRILTAFRGRAAADLDALARALCQVGDLACEWRGSIEEFEINPLFVLPAGGGVMIGDALAITHPEVDAC